MPIERRTSSNQRSAIVMMIAASGAVALGLFLLIRAAGGGTGGIGIRLGDDTFDAGRAKDRAATIEASGPLLFSDVSGNGQSRPIYLNHLGADPAAGWVVVSAIPPGAPDACFVAWDRAAREFRPKARCAPGAFAADGTGLTTYPWKITAAETIQIDLRSPRTAIKENDRVAN